MPVPQELWEMSIEWYQNALRSCHDSSLKNFKFQREGKGEEEERGGEGDRGREGNENFHICGDFDNLGDPYLKLQYNKFYSHSYYLQKTRSLNLLKIH